MKQRSERRWIIFPFGFGCASRSSVADDAPTDTNHATPTSTEDTTTQSDSSIIKKINHPLGFRLPKPNLSHGIRRFFRNLKNVSQLFVNKDDKEDEDDNDKDEGDMEIGYPTDVKHLTHIGWDGSTTVSKSAKDWENLTPSEIISFPSISLKQFEVAMAKQAAAAAAATTATATTADKNIT